MPFYRFEQMAECLVVRVAPADTTLDRYVGLEHLDPETLKIRRWGTPGDVIGEKLHFWPGDIIFGKRRAYQRKLAVADFEGICSAHAMVLRARPDVVLPEFLPFFMQSDLFMNRALEISVGSLSPTINWRTLAEQEFPLLPLEEQRRIADLLWAADDNISFAEELLIATKSFKKTTRHHAIVNGVYKLKSTIYHDNCIDKWPIRKLSDLCLAIIDCPHTTPNFVNSGVMVLRNFNIKDGQLILDDPSYTSEEEYNERIRRLTPLPGDVVFSREAPFGESCVIPDNIRLSLGQRTMLFRLNEEFMLGQFLVEYFYSSVGQHKLASLSTGTTALHVNVEDMRSFPIRVPPIEDQRTILGILKSCDNVINICITKIHYLRCLKKELLNFYVVNII